MVSFFSSTRKTFRTVFSDYVSNLRYLWANVILLYRYFVHWNISKIIIFLYANIAGFILSIPFITVIIAQYFFRYSKLLGGVDIYSFIGQNYGAILLTIGMLIIIAAIFIATYTYGYFLLLNVYRFYLGKEKMPYLENLYFSWRHFWTYVGIISWSWFYLLMPIGALLVTFIPLVIAIRTGIFSSLLSFLNGNLAIGAITMLIFLLAGFWFANLYIRLFFAVFELLWSDAKERAKSYVRRSLERTKGKIWKIILLALPFLIVIGIISSIANYGQNEFKLHRAYDILSQEQSQEHKSDQILFDSYFSGTEKEREEYENLKSRFSPRENAIDRSLLPLVIDYLDMGKLDPTWKIYATISVVLSYILLEWVGSMVYLSIHRILQKENKGEL